MALALAVQIDLGLDQGSNFERLLCPHSRTEITDHFSGWMEVAYQSKFEKRKVFLPCCGKDSDLRDLVWQWRRFCEVHPRSSAPSHCTYDRQTGSFFMAAVSA
jgi:hypothetical protein